MAEDRTVLANERTFAGWVRTGLATIAIGLGFSALFRQMEPVCGRPRRSRRASSSSGSSCSFPANAAPARCWSG
ncbi:DUF202 domain-containing protein [Allosphingosinicella sp.]|uniref:DUF202 domain-containing protein n=1 Tax=Allosphingosinicella sp. TaxID=2823234 RepID=UPI002FC1A500